MKTKKTLIVVLTATLLVLAALIVGCVNQIDERFVRQDAEDSNYKVPVGKGVIRLKLSDQKVRTIMPDPDSFPLTDMYFEVKFTNKDPTKSSDVVWFPHGITSDLQAAKALEYDDFYDIPITLTKDETYNIIISAFDDEDRTTPIAGWNNTLFPEYEDGVTIGSGTKTVNANLYAFVDGAKMGFFSYDILLPDLTADFPSTSFTITDAPTDYNVAKLDLIRYGGGSIGGDFPIDFLDAPFDLASDLNVTDSDISVPSGYYIVRITLEADNCQERIVEEIMHIYPAMTSVYGKPATKIEVPILNQNNFTITFNSNDGSVSDSNFGTSGVLNYENISNGTLLSGLTYTAPDTATYNFEGWVTTQGGSTTFADTKRIYQDRALWAKWSAKSSVAITMTFTFSDIVTLTPGNNNVPAIAHENFIGAGTGSLTFTLAGENNIPLKSVTWKVNNKTLSGGTVNSGVATITIDKDTLLEGGPAKFESLLVNGMIQLTVEATTNDGLNQTYGASTWIKVYNP